MVGLVLVSHSRRLAEAACLLAKGVSRESDLPVAFAGGAGDDHLELGTDATDIMEAIRRVDGGDGVMVLMDLGSAVLSARMAEELLNGTVSPIRLCPAPLVEGAVAAAVHIAAAADIDEVYEEAKIALLAKIREFAPEDGIPVLSPGMGAPGSVPADAVFFRFSFDDPNGMHARPAAELVKAVRGFNAEVRVTSAFSENGYANARSLNQIALAGIRRGDIVEFAAWGKDSGAVIESVKKLVAEVYRGREIAELPAVPAKSNGTSALFAAKKSVHSLSPGVAMGKLAIVGVADELLKPVAVDDPDAEVERLRAAVRQVRKDMAKRRAALPADRAAILDVQGAMLDDEELLGETEQAIRHEKWDAASAFQQKMAELARRYRSAAEPYIRERAADVAGLSRRVVGVLSGRDRPGHTESSIRTGADSDGVVVWSPEISPIEIAQWPLGTLRGILTLAGGPTSHSAILARSMGIPAITGYALPDYATDGMAVAMDANILDVALDPEDDVMGAYRRRLSAWRKTESDDLANSAGLAETVDGERVSLWANVGDPGSVEAAAERHAEGIGLLRTEFLFLDRSFPPDEEEQTAQLAAMLRPFAGKPVTVRVLDAGGDKSVPWLDPPVSTNPFLGVRGVRLLQAYPPVLETQMRAILRAGGDAGCADLRVMVPMVATMEEVAFARGILDSAHRDLERESIAHVWPVRFGIMVETPAAVLQAERMAEMADFFSIGTNDLTQYIMCAERGSGPLAELSDGMHPAVLASIRMVVDAASRAGREVSVCGEMAADPVSALALVGLGIRRLSVGTYAVGRVKHAVRMANAGRIRELSEKALTLDDAEAVKALFR